MMVEFLRLRWSGGRAVEAECESSSELMKSAEGEVESREGGLL